MDLGSFNAERAFFIVQTLQKLGVSYFCLSPGSRNTPLSIALSSLPKEDVCVHFDERGLGFHALGYSKGANKAPVAIITTSGTAVTNLTPAITEAAQSHIPLIIISADRPPELRNCSANQTIDQVKLFQPFVRFDIDLPFSDPLFSYQALSSTLSHAVYKATHSLCPGPVHLNCMIREPLFSFGPQTTVPMRSCEYAVETLVPSTDTLKTWSHHLSSAQKGIIILGDEAVTEDVSSILQLARQLNWPIISDIISGGRQIGAHPHHVEYADLFLKSCPDIQVDTILHIGGRLVSKTIGLWMQKQENCPYFLVSSRTSLYDPMRLISHKITCTTRLFCEKLCLMLPKQPHKNSSWLDFWQEGVSQIKQELRTYFAKNTTLSEIAIAKSLQQTQAIYLSNSMPVRDADLFLYASEGTSFIYSNRGVSGSDGNIATAIGIAKALKKPLVVLLGDLAMLHDMNSLALCTDCPIPITFLVVNNQGGGIFSFLPAAAEKKDILERFFAASHTHSFAPLAQMFCLPYHHISSWEDWKKVETVAMNPTTIQIIECKTSRADNVPQHEELYAKIRDCLLCSTLKLEEIPEDILTSSSFTVS